MDLLLAFPISPRTKVMSISVEEVAKHPFTRQTIRKHANKLIRNGYAADQDLEALMQEILARVLRSWDKFDADVGHFKSFVCTVVNRSTSNIGREHRARIKGGAPILLSTTVSTFGEDSIELASTIGEEELDRRLDRKPSLSSTDRVALAHDLKKVLETLTPEHLAIVERLKSQSLATISTELGLPRSTVVSRLDVIREIFREAGLQEYLKS
jgi:RNA polymerase sigma factor (sigma-70 family)